MSDFKCVSWAVKSLRYVVSVPSETNKIERTNTTPYVTLRVEMFYLIGERKCAEDHAECDETEDASGSATHTRRKRHGPLIEDLVTGKWRSNSK